MICSINTGSPILHDNKLPCKHAHMIAGQGSMGLEILEQVPELDAIVVPVGGDRAGGL